MENLIYLAKINLYWIILYACFWLFFRQHTFFSLNRFYLLGTLLAAIFLPLITLPETTTEQIPEVVYSIAVSPDFQNESMVSIPHSDWTFVVFMIYLSGVIFMTFRMLTGLYNLFSFIRKGKAIKLEDHTLVLLSENLAEKAKTGSFSFFKWLVISQDDYENCLKNILRHELVHIRQKHSIDIMIVEILKIVFWFNPVLRFYKMSMQQVHEFLADASASDREDYATFLISYSFNTPVQSLSNPFFNSSLLKSRIKMIFQHRTPRWQISKYMMVLPVLVLLIMLTAAREQLAKISDYGSEMVKNKSFQFVENAKRNEEQPKLSVVSSIDKRLKPVDSDTVPGKAILDRNAYFQNGFRWTENYFYSQIKYPIEALVADIQGKVRVSFIVDENGDILDAKIVDGLGYGIDEEALRVVQNMPKWHPAIKNGKPEAVRITMGIDFYPALAGGRRKSNIDLRKEYYNKAPRIAQQDSPILTISEIGKRLNKALDFSDANFPKARLFNYGYTMSGSGFLPSIQMSSDSLEIKR